MYKERKIQRKAWKFKQNRPHREQIYKSIATQQKTSLATKKVKMLKIFFILSKKDYNATKI